MAPPTVIPEGVRRMMCSELLLGATNAWYCEATGAKPQLSGSTTRAKGYTENDIAFCNHYRTFRKTRLLCPPDLLPPHPSMTALQRAVGKKSIGLEHTEDNRQRRCIPRVHEADVALLDRVCSSVPTHLPYRRDWGRLLAIGASAAGILGFLVTIILNWRKLGRAFGRGIRAIGSGFHVMGRGFGRIGAAFTWIGNRVGRRPKVLPPAEGGSPRSGPPRATPLPVIAISPDVAVVRTQLELLAHNGTEQLRGAGTRFVGEGTVVQRYMVHQAILDWLTLAPESQRAYSEGDPTPSIGNLPAGFLTHFALRYLMDDAVLPLVRAAARGWAARDVREEGGGDLLSSVSAGRMTTPRPLPHLSATTVVPDPEVVRTQLAGLIQSKDPTLREAGRLFQRLGTRTQDYLVDLLIHHWYYLPPSNAERYLQSGDEAILREAVPKGFVKWFAAEYLMRQSMVPAIEEAAQSWAAAHVEPTQGPRHVAARESEFHPRIGPVHLQLARHERLLTLSNEVQSYMARFSMEHWYALLAEQRDSFVQLADEPARGTLPRQFIRMIAEQWETLDPAMCDHGLIYARLLEYAPEWTQVRFRIAHERVVQIREALWHLPSGVRGSLMEGGGTVNFGEVFGPFIRIGNHSRPAVTPSDPPWDLATALRFDHRGHDVATMMNALAHVHPELRRYPDLLGRRAMALIEDWDRLSAEGRELFLPAVHHLGTAHKTEIPQSYVAFWNTASRIGNTARIGSPIGSDDDSGEGSGGAAPASGGHGSPAASGGVPPAGTFTPRHGVTIRAACIAGQLMLGGMSATRYGRQWVMPPTPVFAVGGAAPPAAIFAVSVSLPLVMPVPLVH